MSNHLPKAVWRTVYSRIGHAKARPAASIQAIRFLSDSDESKEWIPPSRPLSGDKGQSHLYSTVDKDGSSSKPSIIAEDDLEDEIQKFIQESQDSNENVQFIDLDQLDLEDFKLKFDSGEIGVNDDIVDEDVDLDQLIEAIHEMEASYADDDEEADDADQGNDGDGDALIEDDVTKQDKFQEHFESSDFIESSSKEAPDWLSTRRAKLSQPATAAAMGMMTPSDARKRRREPDIPVIKHTLLSSDEIITSLINGGARDVKLIEPDEELKSYLGWDGMIIATATSYAHIRVLTDAIVHSLRKRRLAERGVIGAKYGSEGGEDPTMSARARRKRNLGSGKKTDDGWMTVDCRNYVVHVQDEVTRRSLDLEGLWSPGSEEGKMLRMLDPKDEDAVDDFVAANPIPEEYTESMVKTSDFWAEGGRGGFARSGDAGKKGRYTPTNNQKRKPKNRGRYAL
jgi:ribosomal silencing factor RsfS